jgi:anti-anti-sigma factor
MEFKENTEGSMCSITLEGDLTVKKVNTLYLNFTAIINNENIKSISVDLAGVYEMDTAGIQMLMALKTYSSQLNKSFKLINHSLSVLKIIDLYGLAVFFRDKLVVPKKYSEQLNFRYGIKKRVRE